MAIVSLNHDSGTRRDIELALTRIDDDSFGTCMHCDQEIGIRRLQACHGRKDRSVGLE